MKVFVTGGTGVVGHPTVAALVATGHEVRAVCRRDDAAAALREQGAQPVTVDLFDASAVKAATAGSEAILHLATSIPPVSKAARRSSWATNNRLRTETTRHLGAAARAHGVSRFVKESITFMYADAGDRWIDEDAPLLADLALLGATREGEEAALGLTADGCAATVLRFGLFYGAAGNRGTDEMLRLARLRRSTIAGSPAAYMSSIHVVDAAQAVVAALETAPGLYNVCDDEPMTRGDYLDAFARAFARPKLRPIPGRVLRLAGGKSLAALVASQRCSNRRFREASGWAPRHPSAREGWSAEAAAREEAGDA
ncbi:MAG: NAD(P)-dependent oxidoreductase [Actinobacteria bacterium]|nr:NAD(P)-dependent oxidoreductase [Actinomycetota bacterium]